MKAAHRETLSRMMRERWKDPEFRAKMTAAGRAKWKNPDFVDSQIAAMVRRWDHDEFRRNQCRRIRMGLRPAPMANAPRGDPCDQAHPEHGPCIRREPHAYHLVATGSVEDDTFRFHGWRNGARHG